tara:strand:+ start:3843 stop:4709 length:867 start_codon:yes stop_codon:yes gene_type:complete
MLFRVLLIIASLLLLLKEIDMASMYQKAYNKLLQQEGDTSYPGRVERSATPIARPKGLGSKVPSNEQLIDQIPTNIAIYERFMDIRERNKSLKANYEKQLMSRMGEGAVKFSNVPPSKDSASEDLDVIRSVNIKDSGERPNKYFNDLQKEFPNLSTKQISAIIGNLDHESKGFTEFYEQGVKIGGEGDAQWTATRRNAFREFVEENDLNPKSYEASRDFLIYELNNDRTHGFVNWPKLDSFNDPLKSVEELAVIFEDRYLRSKEKRLARRKKLAKDYYTEFSARSREE